MDPTSTCRHQNVGGQPNICMYLLTADLSLFVNVGLRHDRRFQGAGTLSFQSQKVGVVVVKVECEILHQ